MQTEICVENLGKTYYPRVRKGLFKSEIREVKALEDVSLEIKKGEIFGLLGPNGAGKTTLIKCLTTLLFPTSGDAWIHNYHIMRDEDKVRTIIGCMLMGERGLYWKLTGRENLAFFGALYHLSSRQQRERIAYIIGLLNLSEIIDRTVETYSSGQKMKLAFAKALINDAPVLILDEPTNTLDVPSARELRALVRTLNQQGKTVLYTTHIMSEAETLCERVAIIDRGRLVDVGTVSELKASLNQQQVIHVKGVIPAEAGEAVSQLPEFNNVALAQTNGHSQLTVVSQNTQTHLSQLIHTLSTHHAVVHQIAPQEITLEDVFVAKTGRTLAEDTRI